MAKHTEIPDLAKAILTREFKRYRKSYARRKSGSKKGENTKWRNRNTVDMIGRKRPVYHVVTGYRNGVFHPNNNSTICPGGQCGTCRKIPDHLVDTPQAA